MRTFTDINWKELILDHGEKFVLGIALIFVLGSVATTQWGTYDRTPEEFEVKIAQGELAFDASHWPAKEQTILVAADLSDEVAQLLNGTPQGLPLFQYSTRWVWPIRKRKTKLREPRLLPVVELVADPDKILFRLQPETKDAANVGREIASVEVPDPAGVRPDDPTTPNVPRVAVPRNETHGGGTRTIERPRGVPEPDSLGRDGNSSADSGTQATVWEARGMRFVSLRGVIPLKLIVDRFRQALNLDTPQEAYFQVQFWDFELERQTAVPGQNP